MFLNKVVLITGAAAGIGAGTAQRFSKLGARLSLVDVNLGELKITGQKCSKISEEKPLLIKADLNKEYDIQQIIEETISKFNKIDVLINNAGTFELGSLKTTNLQQFDKIFNVNCRAVFYLTLLAIPHLVATKGNIVNISSIVTDIATPGATVYSLSKGFINQFTKNLAAELASREVRVNCVKPGVIPNTNIYKSGRMNEELIETLFQTTKATSPIGRLGKIEDVVNAIVFLANSNNNHMSGVNLSVDGGIQLINTL